MKSIIVTLVMFCATVLACAQGNKGYINWKPNGVKNYNWNPYIEANTPKPPKHTGKNKTVTKKPDHAEQHVTASELTGAQVFKEYNDAVFMVFTVAGENVWQGSGFFINDMGLAVSNAHVFEDAEKAGIKFPNSDQIYGIDKIYVSDKDEDFILFHVKISNNRYIPIADKKPEIGEKVFSIGSPKGLENTFSSGEISQWRNSYLMQISNPIDHGSSGGALINTKGEVIGITTGGMDSHANLNFAVSIDVIKPFLE